MPCKGSWSDFGEDVCLVVVGSGIMGLDFAVRGLKEFVYHPFYLVLAVPFALFAIVGLLTCNLPKGLVIYLISVVISVPIFIYLLSFPFGPVSQGNWYLVFHNLFGSMIITFGSGIAGLIFGIYLAGG